MSEPILSVLYVDDEPLLRAASTEFLRLYNLDTDTASSGTEALEKLAQSQYDVVVSDYQMPGMNGIELLKEIRNRYPHLPFILFTGRGREEVVIEAIEHGADFYLQKGGRPSHQYTELIQRIRVAVERRRENQILKENELRFRSLIQNSTNIILILDTEGRIIYDSPSSFLILGYPGGTLIGTPAFDLIHPEDQPDIITGFENLLSRKRNHIPFEFRIRCVDGTWICVDSIGLNLIGIPGIDGILLTAYPIQERKQAEMEIQKISADLSAANEKLAARERDLRKKYENLETREKALRESEEQFRSMAERSSDLIIMLDDTRGILYASPSSRMITGYSPEELLGLSYDAAVKMVFPFDETDLLMKYPLVMDGAQVDNQVVRILKKDRSDGYVSLNIVPAFSSGNVTGMQISIRDITDRKRAEIALRESEQKFRALVEYSLDGFFILDPVGNILFASNGSAKILGAPDPKAVLEKGNVMEFVSPESQKDVIRDFVTVAQGVDGYIAQYKIITLDRRERWIESIGKTISYGNSPAILISIRDVTERKRSEEVLKKTSAELHQIVRNMSNAFVIFESVFDDTGKWVSVRFGYINEAYSATTGLLLKDIRGKDIFEVWPDLGQDWVDTYEQVAITGIPEEFERFHEPTGLWYHCNVYRPNESPDRICVIVENISKRVADTEAFATLVRSMAGSTGMNSLEEICRNISSWLKADVMMIGEIEPDKKNVRVLSMILDGEMIDDYRYSLAGTPCNDVTTKGFCIYPDDVAALFPDSQDLIQFHIRGYIGTPLKNSQGEIIGILCILFRNPINPSSSVREIMDIIAVKAAAEIERNQIEKDLIQSRSLLMDAMDMARLCSWEYGEDGQFIFDNPFYALYGTTAEREGGTRMSPEQYVKEFVYPADIPAMVSEVRNILSTAHPGDVPELEHRIIRRDGQIRHMLVRIRVIRAADGTVVKTYGVNQDITERKAAEEAIKKANRQLNLLTSIARHDILNSLSLGLLHLDSAIPECSDPRISANLENIQHALENIHFQIEFTRVYQDLGSHEPQWFVLDDILPWSSLPDSISQVTETEGVCVYADPMLPAVFFNLLDNSIRHGNGVSQIHLTARISGPDLILSWEDNGTGIPDGVKEQIFTHGYGSNTGIGLFLIREILSLTGISITETGVEGTGARFEMLIPDGNYRFESQTG